AIAAGAVAVVILISSLLGFVLMTVPRITINVTLLATAVMGAAAIVLGIDCFTTTGSKEFWLLILGFGALLPFLTHFLFTITSQVMSGCYELMGALAQWRLLDMIWKKIDKLKQLDTDRRMEVETLKLNCYWLSPHLLPLVTRSVLTLLASVGLHLTIVRSYLQVHGIYLLRRYWGAFIDHGELIRTGLLAELEEDKASISLIHLSAHRSPVEMKYLELQSIPEKLGFVVDGERCLTSYKISPFLATSMLSNTNSGSEVYSRAVLAVVTHPGIEIMLHILNNMERTPQVFETLLKGPRFVENEPHKRKKSCVVNLMWKIGCLSEGQQIFPTKQDINVPDGTRLDTTSVGSCVKPHARRS
ncbi:hypothetical protein VP01_3229g1, partial [Puccinia sorghi]